MIEQNSILEGFKNLFLKENVIFISGKSGTGKTTLALYLVGNFLTFKEPYNGRCIWIQSSEAFPKKRLQSIFYEFPRKAEYLGKNVLVIPKGGTCRDLKDQSMYFEKIINPDSILPPNIKFIVVDNISKHLRYTIGRSLDIKEKTRYINQFFNNDLFPLIMFCNRENINLILLHEVSYNPELDRDLPFLYKNIYSKIDSVNIELKAKFSTRDKLMKISFDDSFLNFEYIIQDNGIVWYNK